MEEDKINLARDIILFNTEPDDVQNIIEYEKEIRRYKSKINKIKKKLAKRGKLKQEYNEKNKKIKDNIIGFCDNYRKWYENDSRRCINLRMMHEIKRYYEEELQYWENCLIKILQEEAEKDIQELE